MQRKIKLQRAKTKSKLHRAESQKAALDEAVRTIVGQPETGETKVGDLARDM
ncbi:type II toxin-antitoxin system RelE/ParE family toxin [Limnohabitans sp. 63ED37-2]|uniref:type II toxin-antitoxin system RelE/ParE family toxin n=1 Tax=Limnohabitans sp. 63ED37-2 TaxID=1678128 RepID=UPI0009E907FA|nr:type II toxin-antitoxin system RelE/ParE family toxin [Limnohabitans sp. 63ED37-2]